MRHETNAVVSVARSALQMEQWEILLGSQNHLLCVASGSKDMTEQSFLSSYSFTLCGSVQKMWGRGTGGCGLVVDVVVLR